MYVMNPYWSRATFTPVWSISFQQALEFIKEAVQGERNDELFYDQLIKLAPNREQALMITSIRDDERGHNQMFRGMYRDLTGHDVPSGHAESYEPINNYISGLQKAIQGEWSAVEKYRKIWFGLPNGVYKDTVLGIILDELKHADKYNNLLIWNMASK